MKNIFNSASRLVLILLTLGLIAMSLLKIPINKTYETAITIVYGFYFVRKIINPNSIINEDKGLDTKKNSESIN